MLEAVVLRISLALVFEATAFLFHKARIKRAFFVPKRMNMSKQILEVADYYKTSDLGLAALISLHYPIDSIDKADSQKVQFLFKRDEQLDKLVEAYWRQETKAETQAYFNQLRFIKSRLYEHKRK